MSGKYFRFSTLFLSLLCLGVLIGPSVANAQIGGDGTINGTIVDSNGAVVPAAAVVAKNIATGVETTRRTTDAGLYVISPLPPGKYSITVSLNGFQTIIQENVIVDADDVSVTSEYSVWMFMVLVVEPAICIV